ncbi:MAG TPA: SIR2 family protein [Polyangiaceae bacterium]|nr:SIR2 family protein [Polyangiaceae bacterium]
MQLLQTGLRAKTHLFVGLSGEDQNLKSMLKRVQDDHARQGEHLYWGVRFSADENDPLRNMWDMRGVFQHTVRDYDDVPRLLLRVCQRAAELRAQQ